MAIEPTFPFQAFVLDAHRNSLASSKSPSLLKSPQIAKYWVL